MLLAEGSDCRAVMEKDKKGNCCLNIKSKLYGILHRDPSHPKAGVLISVPVCCGQICFLWQ